MGIVINHRTSEGRALMSAWFKSQTGDKVHRKVKANKNQSGSYILKGFQSYKDGSFRIIALSPEGKTVSKKLDKKDRDSFHTYTKVYKHHLVKKYFK